MNKVTTAIGNDANGSITNLPGGMGVSPMILAYDCENNLHCVSNAVNGTASLYWYDPAGRRIAKQESGLLTLYIWDGMDIIATANAAGEITAYFTRGAGIAGDVGSLIAETRFDAGATTTVYLHSNWRGDVVMATDTAGNVVGEYAYTTFGEQLSATGTYTPRFTFSSKERDASGLVYYGFRYYSPVLCRWISEDPLREPGGINLYQFCGNNPVNRIDRDGRIAPFLVSGAIGAAIGGTIGGVVGGLNGGWRGAVRGMAAGAVGGFVTGSGLGLLSGVAVTGFGTGAILGAGIGGAGGLASGVVGETVGAALATPCERKTFGEALNGVGQSIMWGTIGGTLAGGAAATTGEALNEVVAGVLGGEIDIWTGYVFPGYYDAFRGQ